MENLTNFASKKQNQLSNNLKEPFEDYETTDFSAIEPFELENLSVHEICAIIYRFDNEKERIQKELEVKILTIEELQIQIKSKETELFEKTKIISQLQGQLSMETEQTATTRLIVEFQATEMETMQSEIAAKEKLLEKYKIQIENLNEEINYERKEDYENIDENNVVNNLKVEISRLKLIISESQKSSELNEELKITNKMLENDLEKFKLQLSELKVKTKYLEEKNSTIEKSKQEFEIEVHKKTLEIENLVSENQKLLFEKDSFQTEIKSLHLNLNSRQAKINKKNLKIEHLEENLELKQTYLDELKAEMLTLKNTQKSKLEQEKRRNEETRNNLLNEKKQQIETLQAKVKNLKSMTKNLQSPFTESLQNENSLLKEKIENLLFQNEEKSSEIEFLKKKQENAKIELQYIEKKIQNKEDESSFQTKEAPIIDERNLNEKERSEIKKLKAEFEFLYKMLMKLIMTGSTETKNDTVNYVFPASEFSNFEKRLNNLVMEIHESVDVVEIQEKDEKERSSSVNSFKKFAEKGPIKLFACMGLRSGSKPPPSRTIEAKKVMSNTGDNFFRIQPDTRNNERSIVRRGNSGFSQVRW